MEEYNSREKADLLKYIEEQFGKVELQLLDRHPGQIRVDIGVIPPKAGRNYYTLVTMGVGAHEMNTPAELEEYRLQRAELVMCLPYYWQLGNADQSWIWPVELMRQIALHALEPDEWLGWGYYVKDFRSFADNTKLCGAILYDAECFVDYPDGEDPEGELEEAPEGAFEEDPEETFGEDSAEPEDGAWDGTDTGIWDEEPAEDEYEEEVPEDQSMCILDGNKVVNFYQIMPLMPAELGFLETHEPEELLSELGEVSFVVNPVRGPGV